MDESELAFWEKGGQAFYRRMLKGHNELWSWVSELFVDGSIKSVIEIGGSYSQIPPWIPKDGFYTNIDPNVGPTPTSPDSYHIVQDFRDVDPETLPECDLLCAFAVIEHCSHYSEFFDWAFKVKANRIVGSFFNRLSPETFDSIGRSRKGEINWNRYSESGLRKWLYTRGLDYSIIKLENDDVVDIRIPCDTVFDSRIALANKMGVEVRHDSEQLRELFEVIRARQPSRMIEVGSFRGGTALVFAGALTGQREMLLVDLPHRRALQFLQKSIDQIRQEGVRVKFFNGDSASLGANDSATKFSPVDVLYIDGCHETPHVIHDYLMYRRFVKDEGLIGFHDVSHTSKVRRAWIPMTKVWDEQGLGYSVIGGDQWDRKARPWATGIGVLEWERRVLDDTEKEATLWEMAARIGRDESLLRG